MSTSQVPLFSASKANANLDLAGAVSAVIESHWYVLGNQVKQFEAAFAQYVGVTECISVANGSDALELALKGVGVLAGDKVVCVANAGFYSSTAIHAVGAAPLYADIDPDTLTLCPKSLASLIADGPKAIIVTHLYGLLADMTAILEVAGRAGIPVIEDCAQSHGARRNGKSAGASGTVACFSFYPTKNLGALGDGGAVATSDEGVASRIRQLRQYGWSAKYTVAVPGGRNSRLDEIQAAILSVKLPHLDAWNAERRRIALRYNEAFADLPLRLPASTGADYVAHLYVVRTPQRSELAEYLKGQGITSDIHYPIPDHKQPAYPVTQNSSLEHTERACEEVLSLPCFPGLGDEEVERVIAAVQTFFHKE